MVARSFIAGVTGAALIGIVSAVARGVGIPYEVERLWGGFLTGAHGADGGLAYVVGLLGQLAAGGSLGVAYVRLLARAKRPGLLAGAFLGLLHALTLGVLLALVPYVHPAVPAVLPAPGLMMLGWGGAAGLLHVILHVAFGMWMSHVVATPHPLRVATTSRITPA
jgi:hypothetical protein